MQELKIVPNKTMSLPWDDPNTACEKNNMAICKKCLEERQNNMFNPSLREVPIKSLLVHGALKSIVRARWNSLDLFLPS